MKKYYVIERTKTKDSEAFAIAETIKDDKREAESLYHQILASVCINENIEYAVVKIDDYYGNTLFMRSIIPTPVAEA